MQQAASSLIELLKAFSEPFKSFSLKQVTSFSRHGRQVLQQQATVCKMIQLVSLKYVS